MRGQTLRNLAFLLLLATVLVTRQSEARAMDDCYSGCECGFDTFTWQYEIYCDDLAPDTVGCALAWGMCWDACSYEEGFKTWVLLHFSLIAIGCQLDVTTVGCGGPHGLEPPLEASCGCICDEYIQA
jgi:hypothetical protein